jgi:diguanylate cyclase (GGDEF)-like protein
MSQPNPDLFDQENRALLSARDAYSHETGDAQLYRDALGELISCYGRLLRETRRLIRRSDREEFEMNQLNSRLHELASELEYRATHDSLTGTLNRAAVIEAANKMLNEKSLALIVLDIDFFKQVNDSFGHLVGDEVICGVVKAVAQCLPSTGVLGRVGGEEFTVLLTDGDYTDAFNVAEQMRAAIASHNFSLPAPRQITASFGVSWTAAGADFSLLYGLADEALYKAKHSGRNCVIRADQSAYNTL